MNILARTLTAVLAMVLAAGAFFGLTAGPNNIRAAHSPVQWLATVTELGYAVAACIALWLMVRRDPRQLIALIAFACAVTLTAGLAPVLWGDAAWRVGAISAGVVAVVSSSLIGARAIILARVRRAISHDRPGL